MDDQCHHLCRLNVQEQIRVRLIIEQIFVVLDASIRALVDKHALLCRLCLLRLLWLLREQVHCNEHTDRRSHDDGSDDDWPKI